ncbi:MAG: hypothetical protein RIC56_01325 [Pseudomonadales bacterium]
MIASSRSPKKTRCVTAIAAAAALYVVVPQRVEAAWVVEPAARAEVRHDDNVRMSPTDEEDGLVNTLTGQLTLRQVTERADFAAIVGATYLDYSGVDLDDEDIEFLQVRGIWEGERVRYGLRGSVRRDVLLRTADTLDDFTGGAGDEDFVVDDDTSIPPDDVDVGSVETQIRRIRTDVSPRVDFELGARTGLGLAYRYYANEYDEEPGVDVQDGEQHEVGVELARNLSEISTFRLRARAARFDPEVDETVDSYEIVAGLDRRFSDRFFGSIEVGGRRAETDQETDNGFVVRLRGIQSLERGRLAASLERSLVPSTSGDMVERDTARLQFYRSVSDRVAISVESRAYRISESTGVGGGDRDYVEIEPRIERALSPSWSLGLSYRYRWVDRENEVDSASSNAVSLFLSFRPPSQI